MVRSASLLRQRLAAARHEVSDAGLSAMPEFEQRVAVLTSLGYLDEERTVTLKGRVTCEINSTQVRIAFLVSCWSSGCLADVCGR